MLMDKKHEKRKKVIASNYLLSKNDLRVFLRDSLRALLYPYEHVLERLSEDRYFAYS